MSAECLIFCTYRLRPHLYQPLLITLVLDWSKPCYCGSPVVFRWSLPVRSFSYNYNYNYTIKKTVIIVVPVRRLVGQGRQLEYRTQRELPAGWGLQRDGWRCMCVLQVFPNTHPLPILMLLKPLPSLLLF